LFLYQDEVHSEPANTLAGKALSAGISSAGIGFEQAKKLLCVMGVHPFSYNTFVSNLSDMDQALETVLQEVMAENREKEKAVAIAKGNVTPDGRYKLAVISDAVYSMKNKRTENLFVYLFNILFYNILFLQDRFSAKCCAVPIFGAETNMLIDFETISLVCHVCSKDEEL
jgi:hypothetical protein